jgi:hypothetical protein
VFFYLHDRYGSLGSYHLASWCPRCCSLCNLLLVFGLGGAHHTCLPCPMFLACTPIAVCFSCPRCLHPVFHASVVVPCTLPAPHSLCLLYKPSVHRPSGPSFSLTKLKMSEENGGSHHITPGVQFVTPRGRSFGGGGVLEILVEEKYFSSMKTCIGHLLGYLTCTLVMLVERAVHHCSNGLHSYAQNQKPVPRLIDAPLSWVECN